ncbi:cortical cell-delineating protein [Oryza sativa Japonica Group]|jgi:hypothetical protein|uniref:Os03g0250400 protein n=8 Tax=Oryza TaxID=4527 RepID=A0A8J8YFE8_ORYSJ|nr:cortical cell-delineating protein [Oryza sativa Japonica Group]XP_052147071.1 cortical cell-delineating protein-like [Oryza glaberrima]EAY89272.1 hypothetical protein OsI_10771 [Oryza sativa Indica Group]KAB8091103.1 hypothetical protein EE612_016521 [Oryza sativa]ABF94988.1 Protease inhibitor/seed storage/LTP family protein, expressed [Oryza sativa Japonica Group]EAZ26286.1 hypothetical protein OsJ_10155 [Oryza sativa Japonica Group]KAF2938360.1 hypothetical protein DAI22_03g112600 [Oryza|eukprot:NP_001049567.1 Os03g0250400 [Oryza sativa Japonica Group]
MAPSKLSIASFFLATALLLLAFASGQTTNAPPPPPPPNTQCPGGVISDLANYTRCITAILFGRPNPEQFCCPAISELPNNVAARCVCAALRATGLSIGITASNNVTGSILKICNKAPLDLLTVNCSRA